MSKTTFTIKNLSKPAPAWYRITKRIIYLLSGSTVAAGTLTRIGVTESDQLLIMGWLILIGEILTIIMGNGEDYIKRENETI